MAKQTVSLVITNYNGRQILEKSLPYFVKAFKNSKNNIIEIILVDDDSKDDSISFIKSNYPEIKIVKHKINRGFSSTVNTGVRSSKGELIAILNNDVYPTQNFLEKVFEDFEKNEVFGVSLNEQTYGPTKGVFRRGFIEHDSLKPSKNPNPTFWVSGGSGVWRRDVWMALGGMDEKLLSPFYWEDIDISYRAQKRGYKLLWEPECLVSHNHETTIGKLPKNYVNRIKERNYLIFTWKNLTSATLFRKHLTGIFKRAFVHPGYLKPIFLALAKLPDILKARKLETKESRVSDEAIFESFRS